MMGRILVFLSVAACLASLLAIGSRGALASPPLQDRLDAQRLKAMIEGFGYDIKELSSEPGKEKWELAAKTEKFNVPIACELSASLNYVWLTVSFGEAPKPEAEGSATKLDKLLRGTFSIQPSHFYITTKGNLMMGIAVENRDLTPALLRRSLDKLLADVDQTAALWGAP